MLYVSTRNKTDSFTAYRAMHNDLTPDRGLFVPLRLGAFANEEIMRFGTMSFSEATAKILNLFFSEQLTGWDLDFCIGRAPVKLENAGYKTVVAELWHNHDGSYPLTRNTLYSRVCGTGELPTQWARIAIDIAILFGSYSLLPGGAVLDIALPEENSTAIAAAMYARKLGIPVEKILIVCSEHSPVWDFVRYGTLNTASAARQGIDMMSLMERIVFEVCGQDEALSLVDIVDAGGVYQVPEEHLDELRTIFRVVAVGKDRADSVAQSVLRTNGYHMSKDASVAFGGLQDYRSRGGESRLTMLLSTNKPAE